MKLCMFWTVTLSIIIIFSLYTQQWWTEELSETCRYSLQNKIEKLVHPVCFTIQKVNLPLCIPWGHMRNWNIDTRHVGGWSVSHLLTFLQGNSPWYALARNLGDLQCWPGLFWREKNLLLLPKMNHNSSVIQLTAR